MLEPPKRSGTAASQSWRGYFEAEGHKGACGSASSQLSGGGLTAGNVRGCGSVTVGASMSFEGVVLRPMPQFDGLLIPPVEHWRRSMEGTPFLPIAAGGCEVTEWRDVLFAVVAVDRRPVEAEDGGELPPNAEWLAGYGRLFELLENRRSRQLKSLFAAMRTARSWYVDNGYERIAIPTTLFLRQKIALENGDIVPPNKLVAVSEDSVVLRQGEPVQIRVIGEQLRQVSLAQAGTLADVFQQEGIAIRHLGVLHLPIFLDDDLNTASHRDTGGSTGGYYSPMHCRIFMRMDILDARYVGQLGLSAHEFFHAIMAAEVPNQPADVGGVKWLAEAMAEAAAIAVIWAELPSFQVQYDGRPLVEWLFGNLRYWRYEYNVRDWRYTLGFVGDWRSSPRLQSMDYDTSRFFLALADGNLAYFRELLARFRSSGYPVPREGDRYGYIDLNDRLLQSAGTGLAAAYTKCVSLFWPSREYSEIVEEVSVYRRRVWLNYYGPEDFLEGNDSIDGYLQRLAPLTSVCLRLVPTDANPQAVNPPRRTVLDLSVRFSREVKPDQAASMRLVTVSNSGIRAEYVLRPGDDAISVPQVDWSGPSHVVIINESLAGEEVGWRLTVHSTHSIGD